MQDCVFYSAGVAFFLVHYMQHWNRRGRLCRLNCRRLGISMWNVIGAGVTSINIQQRWRSEVIVFSLVCMQPSSAFHGFHRAMHSSKCWKNYRRCRATVCDEMTDRPRMLYFSLNAADDFFSALLLFRRSKN